MTIRSRILIHWYLGVTERLFWGCLQKINYSCLAGPGEIPEIVIKINFSCSSNAEIVVVLVVTNVDGFQSKTIYDLQSLLSQKEAEDNHFKIPWFLFCLLYQILTITVVLAHIS